MVYKEDKILAILVAIVLGLVVFTFVGMPFILNLVMPPQPPEPSVEYTQTTYALDSNIEQVSYAALFQSGSIIIDSELNITNNYINSNQIINSTKIENSTVNSTTLGSIHLINDVNLTIMNLNLSNTEILVDDQATLLLKNVTVDSIRILGDIDLDIINSSVKYLTEMFGMGTISLETETFPKYNFTVEVINSSVEQMQTFSSGNYQFINSHIIWLMAGMNSVNIVGAMGMGMAPLMDARDQFETKIHIEDCYVDDLVVADNTTLYAKNTSTITISIATYQQALLENCSSLNPVSYGIYSDAGTLIKNTTGLYGTYYNNTILKNCSLPMTPTRLLWISLLNSAVFNLTDPSFYGSVIGYDNSVINAENMNNPTAMSVMLEAIDSCDLNVINVNLTISFMMGVMSTTNIYQMGNESDVYVDRSNIMSVMSQFGLNTLITNSTITMFMASANLLNIPNQITLKNTTISQAIVCGSTNIKFDNCIIFNLQEGEFFSSGNSTYDNSGISGTGVHYNNTEIIASTIMMRSLINFEINGTAKLQIKDIRHQMNIMAMYDSTISLYNSSIYSIITFHSSKINLCECINATNSKYNYDLMMGGNSVLTINNSTLNSIHLDATTKTQVSNNSDIYAVYTYENAELDIQNSTIRGNTEIWSRIDSGYAFESFNSTIGVLGTVGW